MTDDFVTGVLSPIYFAGFGLKINYLMIVTQPKWHVMLLIMLLLSIPKVLSSLITTFFFGMSARDGIGIGLLLNTKGIMALILLSVAWDRKKLATDNGKLYLSLQVTGELLDNLTSWDVLLAALPVGIVSGAPKVKAMELIDQLEVTRRGPYNGVFGGISFSGDMDIALALSTIVFPTYTRFYTMYPSKDVNKRRQWVAHLQAGAGIMADSDYNTSQF
ncbi:anthranilate synthase alpha subunit 1, chloroplastic-like [Gastrolobium bilobum]|uniref:anthranilate synthase alpha subunit 1, chloroplastic-like n=1 Tax=Gastrolobium bilobum TaxID=150636 RepID=UPI002AB1B663|nr:anthranilate synthase alpha subunit 1, chloroplastic-like [Gastrolobium bilobum]